MILLIIIRIFLRIAIFTLLERKLLRVIQLRLGPNKILFYGRFQPILDGVKLFKKLHLINFKTNKRLYFGISFIILLISLFIWIVIPFYFWNKKILLIFWILIVFGLRAFIILIVGWVSFSKYGVLGSNRRVIQVLRFEINFTLLLMIPFVYNFILNMKYVIRRSLFILSIFIIFILFTVETQRTPADLSEGERELVSGYNTELNSLLFTRIFLAEYRNIISLIIILLYRHSYMSFLNILLFLNFILIIRACFPRIRYDILIKLRWLILSPIIIVYWFIMLIRFKT